MVPRKKIVSVIKSGLRHIAKEQRCDGGFFSLSSPSQKNFSRAFLYSTTFFTSTILSCINGLDPLLAENGIATSAAQFLLTQKTGQWTWNYWAKDVSERSAMPYPDDLDDTFTALAALARHNVSLINEKVLATAIKLLTTLEIKEGGPYKTWLVKQGAGRKWEDVDIVTNSAIAYFLSCTAGIYLPHLERLADTALANDNLGSPYYPGIIHVIYFISRWYKGKNRKSFCKTLLDHQVINDKNLTILEHAMIISSLINFGFPKKISEENMNQFITLIHKEGWRPYALCIDPARNGRTFYAGSSAATAAFCIEALNAYMNISRPGQCSSISPPDQETTFHKKILMLAKNIYPPLHGNLVRIASNQLERISDPKITLLSYRFHKAIKQTLPGKITQKMIERLAIANLYGWAAYRIYDDHFDEESNAAPIAAANVFLRKLTELFHDMEDTIPGAAGLFDQTMNIVDEANAWEQQHCRIPKEERMLVPKKLPLFQTYQNLAERSLGHALGPLTLILATGKKSTSQAFTATEGFFRHYLIARQLHDDAHDWAEDLLRGQINSVGAQVIKNYKGKFSELIEEALPGMRYVFWSKIISDVIGSIHAHIDAARTIRNDIDILRDSAFMEDELRRLEQAGERTLIERDRAIQFLHHYSSQTAEVV